MTELSRPRLSGYSGDFRFPVGLLLHFRIAPQLRVRWRPEFIRAENAELLARTRHLQDQRDLPLRPLKIGNANPVNPAAEIYVARLFFRRMQAAVVDDQLVVNVQPAAIVG